MSLKNLTSDDSIQGERDSVGNSGPVESGLYPSQVKLAYLQISDGGATGLVLNLKSDSGREIRQTLWVTSGKAKGGKNYYEDKDGKKQYLPGFNLANSLALLTVGKEISELDTEEKVVNVYNSEAKKEMPTKVQMVTALLNQEIIVGAIKQVVDKTKKNDAGVYEPTGETREENEIDKFFRAKDKMTTAEIRGQAKAPEFYETWNAKWTGNTRNKAKGGKAGTGTAGAPAKAASKPTTSLFA